MNAAPEIEYAYLEAQERYTANPARSLPLADQEAAAAQAGVTLAEWQQRWTTPAPERTCPLCGRMVEMVVTCRGCGEGAFGDAWAQAVGECGRDLLRQRLTDAVGDLASPDRVAGAAHNAFVRGGCWVCPDCFGNTLPGLTWRTCPLLMMGNMQAGAKAPFALTEALQEGEKLLSWVERVRAYWLVHLNSGDGREGKLAVAGWRNRLFMVVLATLLANHGQRYGEMMASLREQWRVFWRDGNE